MREVSEGADRDLRVMPLPQLISWFHEDQPDAIRSRAAAEILRRFEPLLRKYFRRVGQPADGYADFVQEVMLRMLTALPKLRNPEAFAGLMRHIVIGTAADSLRKRVPEHAESSLLIQELATTFDSSIATALVVRSCLEMLSPRERQVIELLVVEELEVAEIARRLALEESRVRMIKSRAIKRLRSVLVGREK